MHLIICTLLFLVVILLTGTGSTLDNSTHVQSNNTALHNTRQSQFFIQQIPEDSKQTAGTFEADNLHSEIRRVRNARDPVKADT